MSISFSKQNSKGGQPNNRPIIDLREVNKYYKSAAGDFHALESVDLQINAGEFVSIIGKSGSGKSTLLNMITGIDRPTTGEVLVNGSALHEMTENQLAGWRGENLGIIFQFFQLLPSLSLIAKCNAANGLIGKTHLSRKARTCGTFIGNSRLA